MFVKGLRIIAVDFDGTITNEPDMTLKKGAKEVLTDWHNRGYKLILWTCRHGKSFEEACEFLVKHDMLYLFDALNEQLPEIKELFGGETSPKVGADFYIDDKSTFYEINWEKLSRRVEKYFRKKEGI